MAQYRAIFKNAYFKGLTSAVLLTAGLAAGAAQATTYSTIADINAVSGDTVEIDGTATPSDEAQIKVVSGDALNKDLEFNLGNSKTFQIYSSGANTGDTVILDGKGHNITINGSRGSNEFVFGTPNADEILKVQNLDTLNIQKGATVGVYAGSGATSSGITVQAKTINIDDATVKIVQQSKGDSANNAFLRGDNINVTGESTVNVGDTGLSSAQLSGNTRAVLGYRTEQDGTNGAITKGSAISFAADTTLNLNSYVSGAKSTTAEVWGDSLTMTGAFLNVKGTHDSVLNVHTTDLNDTQVVIDQGAKLTITPLEVAQKNGTSYTDYYKNINGSMNVNGGTMVVNGAITLNRGGSLTIGDDVQLTATAKTTQDTAAGADSGAIVIGFASGAVNTETLANTTNPTLNISSKTLKDFVTATENLKYTLTDADGTENEVTDGAGKLVLYDGARVNFTDTDTVEISDFKFGQTSTSGVANIWADLNYGDKLGANTGTDSLGEDKEQLDGNIRMFASNMSIAKSLLSDPKNNNNSSERIYFDANSLIVGSEKSSDGKWAGFDSANSRIGVKGLKAKDDITFIDGKGDTFYLQDTVELNRDYYTKNDSGDYTTTLNDAGRITGDNLVIGNATTSGSMTITGGAFKNEGQALTITSGSLAVSAVEAISTDNKPGSDTIHTTDGKDSSGWDYYKNGNPASLTWTGKFNISGSAGNEPTISVNGASGATATLDLTGANVTWGSGSITLKGATDDGDPYHVSATDYFAVGGEGVLTITGNQLSDYLDMEPNVTSDSQTHTKLTVSGGGVLLVEGAVTGAINFDKFDHDNASAAAGDVNFSGGGRLVSTGELSLVTGVDGSDAGTDVDAGEIQDLTLGQGAIIAQGITINNRNPDAVGNDADLADNVVTVSGGALAVASRLATSNNEILFEGASLVLDSNGFTRYGLSATEGGAVSAAKLTFSGSESTFEVSTGNWTVGANGTLGDVDIIDSSNLIVGADAGEYVRNNIGASLQLDNLSLAGDRSSITGETDNLLIRDGGELTVNTIQAANTRLTVTGGTLTINGRTLVAADFESESEPESLVDLGEEDGIAQAGIDLTGATINVSNQGHFILEDTAANALVKFQTEATDTADIVEVNAALDEANITLFNGSEFRLNFASGTASSINGGSGLTAEQAAMLKDKLGTFEGGSYVNVGQLALNMKYDKDSLTAQWSDIKDFVQVESDVVNNDIKQLLVQGITSSDEISGHFGAVEADVVGQNTIRVNGNLGLHKAHAGYFASVVNANGQRSEVGLTLTSYSTVQLEGAGVVGTLEGQGTDSDSDVIFAEGEYYPGAATVEGDIRAIDDLIVNNDVVVTGNVIVGAAEVNKSLSAKNVTLEGGNAGSSLVTGSLNATEVLTVGTATKQNTLTVANGSVVTRDLVLSNGSTLQVGLKAAESDDPETAFNEAANYTGSLEAQNVDLGNGGVMVDPINELQTAFVSFNKFKDASKAQNSMDLGTINGSVYVGNNSVLGIGSSDLASLREYVAAHQNNGALVDYGSILAVNGQATLGAGHGIVMTAQQPDDFKAYMAENKWTLNGYNTVANSVYFGDGTAMKVTAEAINSIGAQNNKNALITISGNDGQLIADGGEILISGEVRANRQYTLFTDGNGAVDVVNVDKTTAEAGEGITVTTENGFLLGELNSTTGGVVTLGVNENSRAIMAGASDPVYTTLVAYARGYNGEAAEDGSVAEAQRLYDGYTTETVNDPTTGQQTTNRVKDYNYSNYFLNESVATGNGAAAESVARLAIYGGAAQAAISAGASTYDAVSGRMGVGANGANITVADNTQGAALWLAPIYKSSDSDGFDAEGAVWIWTYTVWP